MHLAERVSWYNHRSPKESTKTKRTETYTESLKQILFWKVENTSTETGLKGPNMEAALPAKFRGHMAPISAALQHP